MSLLLPALTTKTPAIQGTDLMYAWRAGDSVGSRDGKFEINEFVIYLESNLSFGPAIAAETARAIGVENTKQAYIASPTDGNIVTTDGSGQGEDSGKRFSNGTDLAAGTSGAIPDAAEIKALVDAVPDTNFANADLASTANRAHTFNHNLVIQGSGDRGLSQAVGNRVFQWYTNASTGSAISTVDIGASTAGTASVVAGFNVSTLGATSTGSGASGAASVEANGTGIVTTTAQSSSGNWFKKIMSSLGIDFTTLGSGLIRFGLNGDYGTTAKALFSGGPSGSMTWAVPPDATTSTPGYMTAVDKTKLDTYPSDPSGFALWSGGTFTGFINVPPGATGSQAIGYDQAYALVTGTAALLTNYNISTVVGGTPASGTIRYNNATQASATELRISCTASDGIDLTRFLELMDVNDTIEIQQETNSANMQKWKATAIPTISGGFATVSVTLVDSAGTGTTNFANALPVITWNKSAGVPVNTDSLPEGSTNKYFTEARVLATVLDGLSLAAGTAITAADSVLSAFGKLQKQITDAIASIALKADLASPALTGTPTAPTATAGTNTTQIATTAFVTTAVSGSSGIPVGALVLVTGTTAPTGTVKGNGAALSRTTYADLYDYYVVQPGFTSQTFTVTIASPGVVTKTAHGFTSNERLRLSTTGALPTGLNTTADYFVEVINANTFYLLSTPSGTRINTSGSQSGTHSFTQSLWGLGDGSTTFNVPDYRGEFMRGWDDGRGVDTGRAMGSWQDSQNLAHTHTPNGGGSFTVSGASGPIWTSAAGGTFKSSGGNTASSGGSEARPINIPVLVCIKY